jgi:hypothetical protein
VEEIYAGHPRGGLEMLEEGWVILEKGREALEEVWETWEAGDPG